MIKIASQKSRFGESMSFMVPDATVPVDVAVDYYGEKEERAQVLIYPPELDEPIAIRFNKNGTLAEISIPDNYRDKIIKDLSVVTPWLIERDGR